MTKSNRLCEVCGSNNKVSLYHKETLLCQRHYMQMKRNNKISGHKHIGVNDYAILDSYAFIILRDRFGEELCRAKIDCKNLDKALMLNWYFHNGYAWHKFGNANISLHRYLLDCSEDLDIDHINGDTLDNTIANLRICSHQNNMMNMKNNKDTISRRKGVYFRKDTKKWNAHITIDNKKINLGCYSTLEEAISVREKAEKKYFKEYRRIDISE